MTKKNLIGLVLLFAFSCNKDNDDDSIRQEKGNVWLSGGLMYCAEQIHLDNGDTLIVNIEDVISFTSGDRVSVKYKELGRNIYVISRRGNKFLISGFANALKK